MPYMPHSATQQTSAQAQTHGACRARSQTHAHVYAKLFSPHLCMMFLHMVLMAPRLKLPGQASHHPCTPLDGRLIRRLLLLDGGFRQLLWVLQIPFAPGMAAVMR